MIGSNLGFGNKSPISRGGNNNKRKIPSHVEISDVPPFTDKTSYKAEDISAGTTNSNSYLGFYQLGYLNCVWFCVWFWFCDGGLRGSWKKGTAPLPRA